jgi:adenosylcobinamide kinase/adenosylcobinamide-phosphate guanylyltransferase
MASLTFITGGARSGKSSFAETAILARAGAEGIGGLAYLATGVAMDAEFAGRIDHHRSSRSPRFHTFEESLYLSGVLETCLAVSPLVLLECVSTWLGNIFHHFPEDEREAFALAETDSLLVRLARLPRARLYVVTNEVGLGIVPADASTRQYRDVHGRINRRLAEAADEAWLIVSGLPLRLR